MFLINEGSNRECCHGNKIFDILEFPLLKGHKMLNFVLTFFLKISEILKARISGTETDINKW